MIVETAIWLYLAIGVLPALIAWRRGLPSRAIRRAAIAGALFGWTLIAYVVAWIIAIDDPPGGTIRVSIILR